MTEKPRKQVPSEDLGGGSGTSPSTSGGASPERGGTGEGRRSGSSPDSQSIPLTTAELEAVKVSLSDADGLGAGRGVSEDSGAKTIPAIPILSTKRLGNYPLLDTLGSGGMAIIYRSVQQILDRPVALKVLKPEVAGEEMFAARFRLEARTLAALRHENIVQVYDYGVEGGLQFMVMEYLEGVDLFELMDHYGPLPPELAAVVALHVARALEHVHYQGIVHRDIKPANIMVTYSGAAKLMDFGIARFGEDRELTEHGTGLGTPSYMSPEQVMGDKLDGRSDIFSLGTVLFEMVTGQKPFVEDEHRSVLEKIRDQRAPRARKLNAAVPRDLERIIARCHQPRKQDRYWPTRELVKALERFLAAQGIESEQALVVSFLRDKGLIPDDVAEEQLTMARRSGYRPTRPVRKLKNIKKKPLVATGLLLAGLASFLLGWFAARWWSGRQQRRGATSRRPRAAAPAPAKAARAGIQFVVQPWAHVHIDGKYVDTTPTAKVFDLPPGRHVIRLVNPYCTPVEEVLTLRPGRILVLRRNLTCPSGRPRSPGRPPAQPGVSAHEHEPTVSKHNTGKSP